MIAIRILLTALALAPLNGCEQEDPAVTGNRDANRLVAERSYTAALERYDAVLELRPGAPAVLYNRGTLHLLTHRVEPAVADLEAALSAEDPALQARAHFNLGVAAYRQAIEALQTFQDALTLTRNAIRHWRDSLALDPDQPDARFNLELAYRLIDEIDAQRVQGQRNAETRDQKTSDNRGQAFEDEPERASGELSNEQAPMTRTGDKEAGRGQAGRQAAAAPETVNEMREAGRHNMSPTEAEELLEMLRQKAKAAQAQHQGRQQVRIREGHPEKFW